MANGLAKEAQCGCSIPFGGQQEVEGLACSMESMKKRGAVVIYAAIADTFPSLCSIEKKNS
ncbi:hypothetical protein [Yersinia intermedia]|uniref:hypothetical protein n=1 Tax=Yersinia intermedia TaxID=631 RepID=UPI003C7E6713